MDMLDLTRIESGRKTREIKQTDLHEVAVMSIHTSEPMAIQRNISIRLDCEPEFMVMADPNELEIILNNLISNAVKYNRENGKVWVVIRYEKEEVVIQVEDTGIGISSEDQERLFKEFTRIKNAKTRDITGSGLGLSIVKKMVGLYDGTITLNSKPDKGSVFTVRLPRLR
jgi:signal transduction histidine kinase